MIESESGEMFAKVGFGAINEIVNEINGHGFKKASCKE